MLLVPPPSLFSCNCLWRPVNLCGALLLDGLVGLGSASLQARLKQLSADQNRNMIGSHMPPEEPLTWRTSEQVRFYCFLAFVLACWFIIGVVIGLPAAQHGSTQSHEEACPLVRWVV